MAVEAKLIALAAWIRRNYGSTMNLSLIHILNLYKTSGHWDQYRENMFPAMEMEGESYVLRPMNCPHHMMIYANRPHSYRCLLYTSRCV